jgi:hypothetical protein
LGPSMFGSSPLTAIHGCALLLTAIAFWLDVSLWIILQTSPYPNLCQILSCVLCLVHSHMRMIYFPPIFWVGSNHPFGSFRLDICSCFLFQIRRPCILPRLYLCIICWVLPNFGSTH